MGEWTTGMGIWSGRDKTLDLLKYAEPIARQRQPQLRFHLAEKEAKSVMERMTCKTPFFLSTRRTYRHVCGAFMPDYVSSKQNCARIQSVGRAWTCRRCHHHCFHLQAAADEEVMQPKVLQDPKDLYPRLPQQEFHQEMEGLQ